MKLDWLNGDFIFLIEACIVGKIVKESDEIGWTHGLNERRILPRIPIRVSHVAIGESSKELAKPNLWILAILAKSINISFSLKIAQIRKCFKIVASERY